MRSIVVVAATVLLVAACVKATPTPTPVPTATPTPVATPTSIPTSTPTPNQAPAAGKAADAEVLRQLAFAYWEAFNAYDADKALSYLEDAYRAERESEIRSDIGQIRMFRVKLGVSEESPPQVAGPDDWEMFLNMKEPIGTRRIRMAFTSVGGEWKITYAEEVK
jgi:hypothetical protein